MSCRRKLRQTEGRIASFGVIDSSTVLCNARDLHFVNQCMMRKQNLLAQIGFL